MKITAFIGGFGFPSSTTELTRLLARHLTERMGAEVQFIELRDVASHLADATTLGFPAPALAEALEAVESADLLLATTATFRGSYAGLFKAFFDLVDPVAMHGKPVVLGATGGSVRHQLVIDHALRPLFTYFGSLVVPTAVYATPEDWQAGGVPSDELDRRAGRIAEQARALVQGKLAEAVR